MNWPATILLQSSEDSPPLNTYVSRLLSVYGESETRERRSDGIR